MRSKIKKIMWTALIIILVIITGTSIFIHQPQFGKTPQNGRLSKVKNSPNYRDGKFQNLHNTPQLTEGTWSTLNKFLFQKKERKSPEGAIPSIKTNLHDIDINENILVWFGHSSYYFQLNGKRFLVDPVFSGAGSPVSFVNKAFKGTNQYSATDIPDIDYLIVTHDHWDHLDYPTIKELRSRVGKVICALGVGEHFEYWGYDTTKVVEMDWNDHASLEPSLEIYCLPARHFSGRGLSPKQSLWVSFLLKAKDYSIYVGGDSGYDTHFAEIGERFGGIDLALLENGQYDNGWKYIHMLPEETVKAGKDLLAKKVIPIHNSKFALSNHPWDEPLRKVSLLHDNKDYALLTPMIGEPVYLKDSTQVFSRWWENVQ